MEPTYEQLKKKVSTLEKKIRQLEPEQLKGVEGDDEKYQLLWETMSQGVIYQSANGKILQANPAAEKVLGLTSDQMQGKTSMDPRWKMIMEDGSPVSGDEHPTMICLKTGKKIGPVIRGVYHPEKDRYVWLSIISIPLFREGEDKPYQAYATFDDITEQKNARENLQNSEERLKYALDSVSVGAWDLDLITHTAHRSLKHDQIFGYKELLPQWTFENFIDHVHPEDVEMVKKKFNDAVKHQKDWSFECRIIRTDKVERWIMATGQHIKGEDGKYSRIAGIVQDITQAKTTFLELQHREKLLAYIIKYDPSAIAVHDKDLNYLFVSDRYIRDYNVKDPDIIGKHHYEVFPDIPEKWRKVHQKVLKGAVLSCDEDIFTREDGTTDYTRWLCWPWHTEKGEIGGIILYTEVITERKKIELKHRETAKQLNLVLEHAGDGIFSLDIHDRATMINRVALKMLGYKREELLGKSLHALHHHTQKNGQPYPPEKCPIQNTLRNGRINHEADEIFWKKDGSSFPVEYTSSPIKEDGEITGAVVSFRDISLRKKAEERIRKLNDQLKEIIYTINRLSKADDLGVLQTIVANAARKLVGARGTTFVVKDNDHCFYIEEDTDPPLWKGNRFPLKNCITGWVMLNKKPAIIEDIYKDERIPIDLYQKTYVKSLAVFPANQKDPRFAIGCYWDTQYLPDKDDVQLIQTLAEAASIAYENIIVVNNLESLVEERTHELAMTNKELEAFSYSVSHDLRAPLRGVSGFTNILLDEYGDKLDEEGLRVCTIIKQNALNMGKLIDDLLAFSRLARKEIKKSCIDIKTLVNSIFHELTRENQRNNIRLRIANLEPSYGDPSMIRQVIANILSNAIKYTSKTGQPEIEVFSENKNGAVVYYFRDNGAGFDMKYKDKIFGVFQRLHSESEFEGTGVGLAIVQRIVHRHGGQVDAEGTPGEGATFWFTLPLENEKKESLNNNIITNK